MITDQTLTITIRATASAVDGSKVVVTACGDGTTKLKPEGGEIVVRTAALIALGLKLQAVFPNAINETVE